MKPQALKARILVGTNYGKTGFIRNCIEEDGQHFYYIRVNGTKGLTCYHSSAIEILGGK